MVGKQLKRVLLAFILEPQVIIKAAENKTTPLVYAE